MRLCYVLMHVHQQVRLGIGLAGLIPSLSLDLTL